MPQITCTPRAEDTTGICILKIAERRLQLLGLIAKICAGESQNVPQMQLSCDFVPKMTGENVVDLCACPLLPALDDNVA